MKDEQMLRALGSWLMDSEVTPPDARTASNEVMARLPETPQRSALRLAVRPSTAPRHEERGLMPARGFDMFSAIKLVTAAVIVALFGGFLTIGVLSPETDPAPPAAVTESASPSMEATAAPEATTGDEAGAVGAIFAAGDGAGPPAHLILGSDGVVLSLDPLWGPGLGLWEPTGESGISMSVLHADTDADRHGHSPGTTVITSEGSYDPDTDVLGLSWVAQIQPLGAEPASTLEGSLTAERRQQAPMPEDAGVATPADEGWRPAIGPGRYDAGIGAASTGYGHDLHGVQHADGTRFTVNPYAGDELGLWAPVADDGTAVGTTWFATDRVFGAPYVGLLTPREDGGYFVRYGSASMGLSDSTVMEGQSFGSLVTEAYRTESSTDGLPAARGSVWVERAADHEPFVVALHGDGTVVRIDPSLTRMPSSDGTLEAISEVGISTGLWRPADDGVVFGTSAVAFDPCECDAEGMRGVTTSSGAGTYRDGGKALRVEFQDRWALGNEARTSTTTGVLLMDRLELEP